MVVAVVLGVPLASALATGSTDSGAGSSSGSTGVTIDKTATALDGDKTTVTLSIGADQTKDKVAVMFLLDKSTSQGMRDEAAEMLQELKLKTNTEVIYNVVIFSGTARATGWKNVADETAFEDTVKNFAIGETTTGTNMDAGITEAITQMEKMPDGVDSAYLVTLSDGISYFWYEDDKVMTVPVLQQSTVENPNPGEQSVHDTSSAWDTFYTVQVEPLKTKSFAEIYGSFDEFLKKVPEKIEATEDGGYVREFGSGYSINDSTLLISPIYEEENREERAETYALAPEISAYQCVQEYADLLKEFDKSFTFAAPEAEKDGTDNTANWDMYPWGKELMEYLNGMSSNAGQSAISNADPEKVFKDIRDEILYEIQSGIVTDVIGDDFDLVSLDSFKLSIGDIEMTGVVDKDAGTVAFGDDNKYVVTYYQNGTGQDSREQFTWAIDVPVEQGKGLKLSYDLVLKIKETKPGIYDVPTNEEATLEYTPTIGDDRTEEFEIPEVSYTVAAPALDISKSKTAENLVKDDNGDWVSDVTLSLPSAEYSKSIDVVFIMDDTWAGLDIFSDSVNSLLEDLAAKENLDVNVGLVTFDAIARDWLDVTSDHQYRGLVSIKDEKALSALKAAVGTELSSSGNGYEKKLGSSNTESAVTMATEMIRQGSAEDQYIIMFSDMYGYTYLGDLTVNGVTYSNVPLSKWTNKNSDDNMQGHLTLQPTKYDSWAEVYANYDEDNNPTTDSFFRISSWENYWSIYRSGESAPSKEDAENAAVLPEWSGNYQTSFEKSTYLTYQNLVEAADSGIQIVIADNDFNPDGAGNTKGATFQKIKNEMLGALAVHNVRVISTETTSADDTYSSDEAEKIFSDIKDELIQLVDAGSYVVDEMGSGTLDEKSYNFDFAYSVDNAPELTVGGTSLKATATNTEGATASWSYVDDEDKEQFTLAYYKGGTTIDGKDYEECFVWTTNVPITKDAQVQLTYRVKLTDPQAEPGTYGQYDRDGSHNQLGLYTNNRATLYPVDTEGHKGEPQDFNKPTVSYTVGSVTITPADITIYMGGNENEGYESVVTDSSGDTVSGSQSTSLPEPGYYLTLPEEINAELGGDDGPVNLGEYIVFGVEGDESRGWTLDRYGSKDDTSATVDRFIYRISTTGENQQDVRLQFSIGDKTVPEDEFKPAELGDLQADYDMSIYPGDVNQSKIYATITTDAGNTYTLPVQIEPGKLHVRYVNLSQDEAVTDIVRPEDGQTPQQVEQLILDSMAAQANEEVKNAFASVPSGTTFTINESSVDLDPDYNPAPSLLFDEVTSRSDAGEPEGTEYADQLGGRAITTAASDLSSPQYEARYLDLVDANNGNVWLKASLPVTVYWPYPEGTDSSYDFRLVHFTGDGLDRDVTTGAIADAINNAVATSVAVEKLEHGVKFTTTSFSPFVLVWGTESSTPVDPPSGGDDEGDLTITKMITGDLASPNDEFTFRVTVDGAGTEKYGNVKFTNDVAIINLKGGQTVTISDLPEGADYTIVETNANGYELVSAENDKGKITDGEVSATFTNDKSTADAPEPATARFVARKVLNGAELKAGQFTFELRDADGKVVATATNDASGTIVFDGLTFDKKGTYEFTISEVNGGSEDYTYDASVKGCYVVVTEEGGKLIAEAFAHDDLVFTNEYVGTEDPGEPDTPDTPDTPDEPGEPTTPVTPGEDVPDTGDHTNGILPAVLALGGVALVGGALVVARRRAM